MSTDFWRSRRQAYSLLAFALAASAALAGCSSKTTAPTGQGDLSGLRLGVFASTRGSSGQSAIYLWDYDANALKKVPGLNVTLEPRLHPSISSDGRFIAYQISHGGSTGDDIEMYDRGIEKLRGLGSLNTAANEDEPAFTGNGKMLCYTQGSGVSRRVRMFDGVSGVSVALPGLDTTGVAYADYSPAPNFDGSLIAFVSTRNAGEEHVYLYDRNRHVVLDSPRVHQALISDGNGFDPSFSSSGRFLTFASSNRASGIGGGGNDIYLLEFVYTSGLNDTLITPLPNANSSSDDRHPSINDTGTTIVFQSNRPGGQGGYDLWSYDRSTSTVKHLNPSLEYNSSANDIEPSLKWPY